MKRKHLLVLGFATLLFASQNLYTNITQPPAGFTGAPGEQTCATSGCHTGNVQLNDASITLGSAGGVNFTSGYAANTQYNVTVNAGNGFAAYGFSLTAVDANGDSIGNFSLSSAATTSLATSNGRQYVGHKNANSTVAWALRWNSPATVEDVYFYLAVNQANGNGNTSGDQVRLKAYKLTGSSFAPFTVGGVGISNIDALTDGSISVFPNPVVDQLNLSFNLKEDQDVKADVYNMNGQLVKPLFSENLGWGEHARTFNIAGELSTGIYLVKLNVGGNEFFKKLVVE